MSEVIRKAANVNFIIDNMIDKIIYTRKQYDAAQASLDAYSMTHDIERKSRVELKRISDELSQKVDEFLGVLV
jgi:hypothetical protein